MLRTNLSEIKTTIGRKTQGVTIFRLQKGDAVASIACVGDLDSNGSSATGNGKSNSDDNAKSSAPDAAHKNGVASAESGDADTMPEAQQLQLDDLEEDGGE